MPSNLLQFPGAAAPPASDQPARDQALDVTASWIVEAPAGSGKTGLLMQRYLKLLAHESVTQPEEILAITFTRKATAELRERILHQLQSAQQTTYNLQLTTPLSPFDTASRTYALAALDRDKTLNWSILDRPQRLNIRTIDSVCAEIASTLPLLSGSGAPRIPSPNAEPLYREAAQRTLMQLGGPDRPLSDAIRTVLLHRDGSLADCETLLSRMLAAREQWGELLPLGSQLDDEALEREVRPKLERALEQIVCGGLTRAAKAMPPDALQALTWLAQRWSGEPGYLGGHSPIALCANRNEPPETHASHLDHWRQLIDLVLTKEDWRKAGGINSRNLKIEFPKAEKQHLVDIISQIQSDSLLEALQSVRTLPPTRYPDEQWAVAKSLFRLLLRSLAELKVLFAERQQCDFTELSLAAKEALRAEGGPADLATASGSTLRHLLVDEMQDTSSSQYDLIQMLTRSWDGHSETLFLVGDPKQSIYLFRQARVERFLRTIREQRLGDIPLSALQLTANFRSKLTLVENFNETFSQIFPTPGEISTNPQAADVPFTAAHATRKPQLETRHSDETQTSSFVWNTSILGLLPDDPDAGPDAALERKRHAAEEARAIRRIVENWRAHPLPEGRTDPWRIAVLARARTHLAPIITEFNRPDASGQTIPFRALEIENLGDRPEVLDALALTRALLHPADRVAWLAVLHAPWCGLGIADLLALSGDGTSATSTDPLPAVIPSRRDLLSADGQPLFDRTWPILESALAQRGRLTTTTWVERTWRSLGGDAILSTQQLININLYFNCLREAEEPGNRVNLALLEASVKRLYAEPRAGDDLVDLSTIHRAKGLEWDVVLIPALERPGQPNRPDFLNWLELDSTDDDQAHVILAPIYGKGAESDALNKWLAGVRSARDAAERKRLFYVACTRAREELHVFAAATAKQSGELCAKHGTLLQAAWPAALPHFHQTPPIPATGISSTAAMFRRAVEVEDESFSMAASEETPASKARPILRRLPLSFNPHARFEAAAANRFPYTPASALRQGPAFDRPEGSFAVRAFGNVVHRYLQLLSIRLEANPDPESLQADLPNWLPRLTASLRSEGLAPTLLDRLAHRSLQALQQALTDPIGRWILSPHTAAHTEQPLRLAAADSELRVDRTFLAGPDPLSEGSSHLWIVDFKTTEQGSRSPDLFAQQEQAKYSLQLQTYAIAQLALPNAPRAVIQALYYPLIPRLLRWTGSN